MNGMFLKTERKKTFWDGMRALVCGEREWGLKERSSLNSRANTQDWKRGTVGERIRDWLYQSFREFYSRLASLLSPRLRWPTIAFCRLYSNHYFLDSINDFPIKKIQWKNLLKNFYFFFCPHLIEKKLSDHSIST